MPANEEACALGEIAAGLVPAKSVQISHRRSTPAFWLAVMEGKLFGPRLQSFQPACE